MDGHINDDRNEGRYGDSHGGAAHVSDGDGAEVGDAGFSDASGNASGGADGRRSDATGKGSIDYGGAGGITSHSSKTTSWSHWGLKVLIVMLEFGARRTSYCFLVDDVKVR